MSRMYFYTPDYACTHDAERNSNWMLHELRVLFTVLLTDHAWLSCRMLLTDLLQMGQQINKIRNINRLIQGAKAGVAKSKENADKVRTQFRYALINSFVAMIT